MIDNSEHAARLIGRMKAALPLLVRMTPELLSTLAEDSVGGVGCSIVGVSYGGDEGGILCELSQRNGPGNAIHVSLTHLRCDPRHPLTREIVLYQKRRGKRIRRALG